MEQTARDQELSTRVVTHIDELEDLRKEWRALWCATVGTTPFQSPEWLIPWWRHVGEGELRVLEMRSRGRLAGLVPLYIYTEPDSGVRKLFILGCGNSDYLDLLAEPSSGSAVMSAFCNWLSESSDEFDLCEFQQLRAESLFLCGAPECAESITQVQDVCPVLDLSRAVNGSIQMCLPASMWQNINYYAKRADKVGGTAIRLTSHDSLDESLEALFELHSRRWREVGKPGVLERETIKEFHRETALAMLISGMLRLYTIHIGSRIAGVLYGFFHAGVFYYYLGGLDPEFRDVSPGTLLIAHAAERAVEEGARTFDFLRGRESYKYLWGARDRVTFIRRISVGQHSSSERQAG